MNLYKLSIEHWDDDWYDAVIVCAESEEDARKIHPSKRVNGEWWTKSEQFPCWATKLDDIKVELVGSALAGTAHGVVLASFHAG